MTHILVKTYIKSRNVGCITLSFRGESNGLMSKQRLKLVINRTFYVI